MQPPSPAPTTTQDSAPQRRYTGLALSVLAALCSMLALAPALSAGWVNFDDPNNFLRNPHYRGLDGPHLLWMWSESWMGHYQPLSWMSLGLDHAVWGMDPFGYHLTNLLLHGLSTGIFWWSCFTLFQRTRAGRSAALGAATVAALFYGIHPLRAESVAWITERRDVLAMVFFQLCLLLYIRTPATPKPRWKALAPALGALILSLSAKAAAITLPVALLIMDWSPLATLSRESWRARLIEKLPFFAAAAVFGGLALWAQDASGTLKHAAAWGLTDRLHVASIGLGFYPLKMIFPGDMSPLYPLSGRYNFPPLVVIPAAIAVAASVIGLSRKLPALTAAAATYAVILAPVSGLAQSGPQLVADRYTYFAGLPIAVGLGALTLWLHQRISTTSRRLLWAGLAAALAVLGLRCFAQTQIWHDSETLWRHATTVQPQAQDAWFNLGVALNEQRRYDEAVEAFSHADAIPPSRGRTAYALGDALARTQRFDEAIEAFDRVPDSDTSNAIDARLAAAQCHQLQGRTVQAREQEAAAERLRQSHHGAASGSDVPLQ